MYKYENRNNCFLKKLKIRLVMSIFLASFIGFVFAFENFGNKFIDITDFKNFDDMIWPVVMQDPEIFDESNPPNNEMMINAAVLSAAMNKKDDSQYYNSDQKLVLKSEEVEKCVNELFGKYVNLSELDMNNFGFFEFVSKENLFLVDSLGFVENYVPKTVNAKKNRENIILEVEYVIPQEQFGIEPENFQSNPKKTFLYKLKKNKPFGKYHICSVSNC